MIQVGLRVEVRNAIRKLDGVKKSQIPFATALALTRTAGKVREGLIPEMKRDFASPTPYTLNSLRTIPATKASLTAKVDFKDESVKGIPADRYIKPNVFGGQRSEKSFERRLISSGIMPDGFFAVPASGARLDAFGNVPRATLNRILSQLQASRDPLTNEPAEKKTKRNRTKRIGRFFHVAPNSLEANRITPGIYERASFAFGGAVRPVFIFTKKRPTYRVRFEFPKKGSELARQEFPSQFRAALERAKATAR